MISKEEIQYIYNQTVSYISQSFHRTDLMEKDLDMKAYFPNMEWFNIACIHAQNPSAIYVNSKDSWDVKYGQTMFIKKGEKSSRILLPVIKDNRIDFSTVPVFDIDQLQNASRIPSPQSHIQLFLEGYGGLESLERLLEIKDHDWKEIFNHIIALIGNIQDQERLHYIRSCIEYMMGIRGHIEASGECCCTNEKAMIYMYRTLLATIETVPFYISKLTKKARNKQLTQEEVKVFKEKMDRGIKQRIKDSGIKMQLLLKEKEAMNNPFGGYQAMNAAPASVPATSQGGNDFHLQEEELNEELNPYNQDEMKYWEAMY